MRVLNLSSIITGWADHLREFACVVRCDPRIRWKRVRGRTALLWEVECLQNVFSTYDWPVSKRCFLVGLETKSMQRNSPLRIYRVSLSRHSADLLYTYCMRRLSRDYLQIQRLFVQLSGLHGRLPAGAFGEISMCALTFGLPLPEAPQPSRSNPLLYPRKHSLL